MLISPILAAWEKLQNEIPIDSTVELDLTSVLLYLSNGPTYLLVAPLIVLYWVFAWSLKSRKRTLATILFVLNTLKIVFAFKAGGVFMLVFDLVVIGLLLQGILGLRKLQATSPLVSESAPPSDSDPDTN